MYDYVGMSARACCARCDMFGTGRRSLIATFAHISLDFDESEEQSKEVREALVEQTINPVFSPAKDPSLMPKFDLFSPLRGAAWADELDSPGPFAPSPSVKNTCDSSPEKGPITPIRLSVTKTCALSVNSGPKVPVSHPVRYSFDDLLSLMDAPLVQESVRLPDTLSWLDKRIDLGVQPVSPPVFAAKVFLARGVVSCALSLLGGEKRFLFIRYRRG